MAAGAGHVSGSACLRVEQRGAKPFLDRDVGDDRADAVADQLEPLGAS
jgi:hypothetical protein